MLRRSSEMGNAFACSTLCGEVWIEKEEEAFRLAQAAALEHERDGSFLLGVAFDGGYGCEKDLNLAKENYLIAAELGHGFAADFYGRLLDESDPVHWIWFARAALRGCSDLFLGSFAKQVNLFFSGSGNAMVVFVIGCALKGNIDMEKKEIFALSLFIWNSLIGPANQAISFYGSQIKSARLAVDTWTLISTRLHVIKDMRMLIGKLIWEARFEANYKI